MNVINYVIKLPEKVTQCLYLGWERMCLWFKLPHLQTNVISTLTHLIREIRYNENEAKREASDVSFPLHVDLPTHCSGDMVPTLKTLHLLHVACFKLKTFQDRKLPSLSPMTRQDVAGQRSSMCGGYFTTQPASRVCLFSAVTFLVLWCVLHLQFRKYEICTEKKTQPVHYYHPFNWAYMDPRICVESW